MSERKLAFVTGGSKGIGAGIAMRLAREGFDVGINARSEEDLKKTAEKIASETGVTCRYYVGDVTSEAQMDRVFEDLMQDFGRLDVLVNNAGICPIRRFEDITAQSLEQAFRINVVSQVICSQRAVKFMKIQGGGKIINAASQSAFRVAATGIEYGATKYAIRGMTQGMAKALAPYNITVNAYCPGYVPTDMQKAIAQQASSALGITPEEVQAHQKANIPLGRFLDPEADIGGMVAYLAGPAGDNITGQSFMVNGGEVMN